MTEKEDLLAGIEEAGKRTTMQPAVNADQLTEFARLLVVLANDLNKAQTSINFLTWIIAILTLLLFIEGIVPLYEKINSFLHHLIQGGPG
jgi:hypothetical protein